MPYYDKFVRMVNGGDLESDKNLDYYKEQSAASDSSGQQSGDSFLPNLTSWANAAANFIAPGRAEALAQYPTYNGGYVKPWDVWGETTQQRFKKNAQEYPHGTAFGMGFAEGAANAMGSPLSLVGIDSVQNAVDAYENYWKPVRDEWDSQYGDNILTNPNQAAFWLGQGIGSTVAMLPAAEAVPASIVGRGTGVMGKALSRVGLGKVAGSAAFKEIAPDMVKGAIGANLLESAGEYGNTVKDLQDDGLSYGQAMLKGAPVMAENMALGLVTSPVEYALMKGAGAKVFRPNVTERAAKRLSMAIPRSIPGVALGAVNEGMQENIQQVIQNNAEDKPWGNPFNPYAWTDDQRDSFLAGAIGGIGMSTPGHIAASMSSRPNITVDESGKPVFNTKREAAEYISNSADPNVSAIARLASDNSESQNDNTQDSIDQSMADFDAFTQKEEIYNFLNNNTVDQIGQENYDWLVGVIRNGTPEEVNKAYESVIKAQKETAAQNKSATRSRMSANTSNSMVNTVIQAANDSDVDPRLGLAIAARESGGDDVNAIRMPEPHDGVYGVMQAQDETVEDLGLDKQYPDWKTDPYQNAMVGMAILKAKIAGENGDVWAGVRAYNGSGPEAEQYRDMVKNNYDNMGDVGNSSGSYDGNVLDENGNPYYDISEADAPNVEGETQDTINKLQILAHDFYKQFGQRLSITSMKRDGDPNASYHNTGNAFDTASDFLEQNKDAREWLMQRGQELGLTPLDEYEHPSANATGGHVHFSNNGGPISGNATVSNSSSDNDIERMQSQFDSEMNQIQADSNAAMNDIMNDDSMERTNAEIDQETEAARKAAQEDQAKLNGEQQVTSDDVVPDVAKNVLDSSQDIDEVNALDGMFTNDANGQPKFVDTPENKNYIKANYKKEIGDTVKQAIADNTTPTTKAADKTTPQPQTEAPHAQLGRILSTFDRNHPQFKQYMDTFRHGTEEQQAALADELQQSQAQARNEAKTTPVTPATPSPNNKQNVESDTPKQAVKKSFPAKTEPKNTVKAHYTDKSGSYQGGLKDGKITIWDRRGGRPKKESHINVSLNELQDVLDHSDHANVNATLQRFARKIYVKEYERWIEEESNSEKLKKRRRDMWENDVEFSKNSPHVDHQIDSVVNVLSNLYEKATGHKPESPYDRWVRMKNEEQANAQPKKKAEITEEENKRKEVDTNEKGDKNNNRNVERRQVESKNAESTVPEKGTEGDVQEEINNESDSNSEDTITDEEREKLAYYKDLNDRINKTRDDAMSGKTTYKEAEKKLEEIREEFNSAYKAKKVDMNDDGYRDIQHELVDAIGEVSSAALREHIHEIHAQKEKNERAIDSAASVKKDAKDESKSETSKSEPSDENDYHGFLDGKKEVAQKMIRSALEVKHNPFGNTAGFITLKDTIEVMAKSGKDYKVEVRNGKTYLGGNKVPKVAADYYRYLRGKNNANVEKQKTDTPEKFLKDHIIVTTIPDNNEVEKGATNQKETPKKNAIERENEYYKRIDDAENQYEHGELTLSELKDELDKIAEEAKTDKLLDYVNEGPRQAVLDSIAKDKKDFVRIDKGRKEMMLRDGKLPNGWKLKEMPEKPIAETVPKVDNEEKTKEGVGNDGQEQGKSRNADGRLESVGTETGEGNDAGKTGKIPGRNGQKAEGIRTSGNRQDSSEHAAGTVSAKTNVGKNDSAGTSKRRNKPIVPLTPAQEKPSAEETPGHDYTIGSKNSPKDEKSRYKQNIKAIALLKQLEADDRMPTPAEQKVLGDYNGWGGLKDAFNDGTPENKELRELLTDEEYKAAQASSLDAFYTPAPIVKAIWKGVKHLGFKQGRVLDPSMGTGNFFGNMPQSMRKDSQLYGVEMDNLTARFAKMLYPSAAVENAPFQRAVVGDNYFDLVISNIPFSQAKVQGYQIHNFFFANGIDKVRPGGLMVFITSQGSLTGRTDAARMRHYLAGEADLIGAFKLPSGTFTEAGTDVATDVVVFRKRDKDKQPSKYGNSFLEINNEGWNRYNSYAINEYFTENADNILGDYSAGRDQFGNTVMKVTKRSDEDVAELLEKGFMRLPKDVYQPINRSKEPRFNPQAVNKAVAKEKEYRDGEYYIKDGEIYQKQYDKSVKINAPKTGKVAQRIAGFITIKNDLAALYTAQRDEKATDKKLSILRKKLNTDYDAFVQKNGYLNAPLVARSFIQDPDAGIVLALEKNLKFTRNGKEKVLSHAEKADVFTMRTMNPKVEITKADTPDDALIASLQNKGYVDMEYMSKLLGGKKPDAIAKALGSKVFKDPTTEDYVASDEYLSGNVREKYSQAVTAAAKDASYQRNVDELKKVIPKDLVSEEIMVNLGSPWIPASDVQDFVDSVSNGHVYIEYYPTLAKWNVTGWGSSTQYRAKGIDFDKLLKAVLNNESITIYDGAKKDGRIDHEATDAANATADRLREDFRQWLWSDKDRARRLTKYYNDNFNNTVLRKYDGSHLTFPWMEPNISLLPHQKNVVWRMLTSGNTLIAHCVGAGKTYEMQAAGMEMRRLGIANKPLYCVPNNVVKQFAEDFRKLCPGAKLLVIKTGKDLPAVKHMTIEEKTADGRKKKRTLNREELTKEERKEQDERRASRNRALARIQAEDWDGIIMSHTMFERLPVSPETKAKYIQQQLDILEQTVKEAKNGNLDKRSKNSLEARKQTLQDKLNEVLNDDIKDIGIPFEELGVDQIFVDEADLFKNLHYETSIGGVSGLTNSDAARSQDMFLKTQWLTETRSGRGVVFATGTPISNTIAELYTMSRYLAPKMLKEHGVNLFDNWIRTFAEIGTGIERKPSGDGFRKVNKVKNFINMAELTTMFRGFADIKTQDELHLNIPKLKNGKPTTIALDADPRIVDYIKTEVPKRIAKIKANAFKTTKGADNMLSLTNDLRHMTMTDVKINACADNIANIFNNTGDIKGAQLVFCDYGIPKAENEKAKNNDTEEDDSNDIENENGEVYARLMQALKERGIPDDQIAFVQSAKNKDQQKDLFEKVDNGEVRILIGSTGKMGAGTNCQHHLVALHDLDAPWRPRDLEQRHGRILRQGNLNDEVEIFNYVIKDSFDANMWEKLKNKAAIIAQAMNENTGVRVVEDADMVTLSYSDVENAATGNPLIKKRLTLKGEVTKLTNASRQFAYQVRDAEYDMEHLPHKIETAEHRVKLIEDDIKALKDTSGDNFHMKVMGHTYSKRKDAIAALEKASKKFKNVPMEVGEIGGLKVNGWIPVSGGAKYQLVGKFSYDVMTGSVAGMENTLKAIPRVLEEAKDDVDKLKARLNDDKKIIEQENPYKEKLAKTTSELAEVEKAIENQLLDNSNTTQESKPSESDEQPTNLDDREYSVLEADKTITRTKEAIKTEMKEAFKTASNVTEDGDRLTFTMPNEQKITVDVRNGIAVTDEELEQAKKDHDIDGNVVVEGYAQTHGKDAYIAVAQGSREGTGFHEAYHIAEKSVLTDKEKAAITKAIPNAEERANKYAEWVESRKHGRGTAFGRLFQKIKDFAKKMQAVLTRTENVHDVFRQIESGKVWQREARSESNTQYSVREEADETQETVTPKHIIDAINDIVKVYESPTTDYKGDASKQRQDDKERPRIQDPSKIYDKKARAGINNRGYFNLTNYGRILALHLDNVLNLTGNLELTNDVLDRQDRAKAAKQIFGTKGTEYTPSQARERAVEDFGAMLIKNPELARERYPRYSAMFDAALAEHPELKAKVDKVIELNETYQGQTAAQRASGSVMGREQVKLKQNPKQWIKDNFHKFYTGMVDDMHPLSVLMGRIESEIGSKVDYSKDVYQQALMAKNVASARAYMLLTGGKSLDESVKVLNQIYKGAVSNKVSLKSILDELSKVSDADVKKTGANTAYDALGNYLIAMRTEELVRRYGQDYARSAGFTEADTKNIIANTPASIKAAARMYWDFNNNLVNIMQQQGIISKELASKLRTYKHYCPMYRDMSAGMGLDNVDDMIRGIGSFKNGGGYVNVKNGIKEVEGGGKRPILDPIVSLAQSTVATISRCERNNVGKTFVQLGQEFSGLGDIVVRDPSLKHADSNAFAFTVWENGKEVVYRTAPEIYEILTNNDTASSMMMLDMSRNIAQWLRRGATISPSFIARNFMRDTLSATINSKFRFIPVVDSLRGAWKLHNDKQFYAEYHASGVSMSTFVKSDLRSNKKLVDELLGDKFDNHSKVVKQAKQLISWAWLKYDKLGNLVEDSTRAAEFMKARDKGLTIDQAGAMAKDITLNFSRHGKWGKTANRYIPFFNATIQGTDKFIRTFHENPLKSIICTTATIILPSIILWAANHDDDWYKELDENVKNTNWCISLGNGTHLLIPKPQEVGILFGSGVEAALNQMYGDNPKAMSNWARQYLESVTPSLMPAVVRPLIEWMTNYSFWTGRNLVNDRLKNLPSEQQATNYTSELAKALGDTFAAKAIKLSPIAIDNWISAWFGSAGRFVAQSLDGTVSAIRGKEKPVEPAKYWYEMPFVGSFIRQDGQNSEYVERLYNLQSDLTDEYNRSGRKTVQKGKRDPNKPSSLKIVETTTRTISKLNKEIRDIQDMPKMSAEQKRQEIDKRRMKINGLAKKVVVQYDK